LEHNRHEKILFIIAHPEHFAPKGLIEQYCIAATGGSWTPANKVESGEAVFVDTEAQVAGHVGEVLMSKP
jgi:hypothetical protein